MCVPTRGTGKWRLGDACVLLGCVGETWQQMSLLGVAQHLGSPTQKTCLAEPFFPGQPTVVTFWSNEVLVTSESTHSAAVWASLKLFRSDLAHPQND